MLLGSMRRNFAEQRHIGGPICLPWPKPLKRRRRVRMIVRRDAGWSAVGEASSLCHAFNPNSEVENSFSRFLISRY
jgi:hypothetical protein